MKNDEMDELKSLWNAASGDDKKLNPEDLTSLIRQRSRSTMSDMRRMLLAESLLGIAFMILWLRIVPWLTPGNGEAYLAALQMALLTVMPLSYFYYAGFRHLSLGISSNARLVSALQQTIAYWDQALRLYFWGGVALLPAFLLSAVWFQNCRPGEAFFKLDADTSWQEVVAWVVALSGFTTIFVWISIKISYRKHVERLKACLQELEEAA